MGHLRSILLPALLLLAVAVFCAHEAQGTRCYGKASTRRRPENPFYYPIARRVKSFESGWSSAHPSRGKMARAGFYHMGPGDEAKCYQCGIIVRDWQKGDNPLRIHRRCSPNCRYLRQISPDRSGSGFNAKDCRIRTSCSHDNKWSKICLYCRKQKDDAASGGSGGGSGSGGSASFCEMILRKIFGKEWAGWQAAAGAKGAGGANTDDDSCEDDFDFSDEDDGSAGTEDRAARGANDGEGDDDDDGKDGDDKNELDEDCEKLITNIGEAKKDLKNGIVQVIDTMKKGLFEKMGGNPK